jgi:hypothetical protein
MTRLIGYEDGGSKSICAIIETEDEYLVCTVWDDGKLMIDDRHQKSRFRDLDHFQGVMGKFDPYALFLKKPQEIDFPAIGQDTCGLCERVLYCDLMHALKRAKGEK